MNDATLNTIVAELQDVLCGRFLGRIFQLSPTSLALDFQLRQKAFLYLSVEPASPRLYLITRTMRELEQQSLPPAPFVQAMRAALHGATLSPIVKDQSERVVRFKFIGDDPASEITTMVAQLTGRSSNLFLLTAGDRIVHVLRKPRGEGQQINENYKPPPPSSPASVVEDFKRGEFATMSEALDDFYSRHDAQERFKLAARKISNELAGEIKKHEKLKLNLNRDLAQHGNADDHKRRGDLLLANIGSAQRSGDQLTITDFFAEGEPAITLTIDKDKSLSDEARDAFQRYGKAKRAVEELTTRLRANDRQLQELNRKRRQVEQAIASGDAALLAKFEAPAPAQVTKRQAKASQRIPGTRSYRSSDGYEIIVGRAARDNDNLTFRVARPNDLWMHAGDYPGSHVIIRNPRRTDVPQRTLIEAAQLAAKFSQASNDAKVTIHYTPRKFLSKPRGAAPGLVRMSSFKSITVEPGENIERLL
ncbi:MAG TPA: NFACT RNA binding domain-containing protein [Pyrinomonadaceae bacterium]|nr:NFACT RNA binding domain-containing protein [Pyrinomonadaceae bacterium]